MKASLGIAADLRQRIASGELKDGDPLPVESELVGQLGASKSVVREALRILEGEGLLEVRRGLGGGPRVRHPSISDAAQGVADRLVAAGVRAILNFAPAVVVVPPEVSLRKVDLATELQILSFYQQHHRRARDAASV